MKKFKSDFYMYGTQFNFEILKRLTKPEIIFGVFPIVDLCIAT